MKTFVGVDYPQGVQLWHDYALRRFYDRVRKRRGKQAGRVAVARKLTEICWKSLMRWHEHQAA